MITVVRVRNPLVPAEGRTTHEMPWAAAWKLEDYLREALRGWNLADETYIPQESDLDGLTVSINGRIWPRSLWEELRPVDGACIVITPTVQGGSLLRTLAEVGVMAAAIAASVLTAGALAPAVSALWTTVLSTAAAGAVSIAGNLLISAFLSNPATKSQSPTYAFDGPQSLARSGTVIPKGYGTMMWGGNIISSFVDVEGNDQYINVLVCYGYGPARAINQIQINGKPIEEYGNVQYYTRLGSNDQAPIPNFNRIVNGYPQNTQCLAGVPVVVPGTGTLTQILQVDVVFPSGLWVLTNDGNLIPATETFLVEYAADGSALTFTGTTTSGSTTLTAGSFVGVTGSINEGTVITGPGIPGGTTVVGFTYIGGVGAFVLSAAATVTGSGTFTAVGSKAWLPVVQPSTTSDVVTYHLDGTPYPYPTWAAFATDLPPNSGVVYATDSGSHTPGDPYTTTQTVTIDYPDGTTSTYSKVCKGEWQLTQPYLNLVQVNSWTAGYQSATFCSQSPCYQRTSIYGLAPGKYDVRVTKYGSARWGDAGDISFGDDWSPKIGQDLWVHNVNEIALLDLAYPNMILLGVRALATGQLSGSSLNVTAVITHGLRTLDNNILPGALQAYEEDNPACVAADMMLDGLYGGGQSPGIMAANIDRFIDEWVAWANLNDELVADGNGGNIRRHVFNGVFDNESNLWDQLNAVGAMSRAQLIPIGRDYGVFTDQPDTPCQIFTMGNQTQDSFSEIWMAIDDRANQVEIQFADSTRFYKSDNPIAYMDPANQDAGVVIKNVRIDGKGITVPAQAWHLARFKERCNQFLLRTGKFQSDVDAIACRPGNLVILQHDVPEWGWGGRTLTGSTSTAVNVDRTDLPTGAGNSLIVLHPSFQRYAGTITAVAPVIDATGANLGTILTLSSFDNLNRVTRCVVGGNDSPITATGAGTVTIQPCAGFTPMVGQAYALFDTDVLDTAAVSSVTSAPGPNGAIVQTVNLAAPLLQAPVDYSTYFYGPTGSQKVVRITQIRKASEFRATLEWIDYDPDVYIDATPIVGETSARIASNPGVTGLAGHEVFQFIGGSYASFASLTWANGPDTAGVAIYATFLHNVTGAPAGQPQMVARLTNGATTWQAPISPGTVVEYTVVGFDINDYYAGFSSAPTAVINAVGVATNLLLGSSFQSGFTYWSITPRSGDALVPDLSNDGEATYTTAGSTLTTGQILLYQTIPASKWAVGQYLMLSAYFEDTCVSSGSPNAGDLVASIAFVDSSNAIISTAAATSVMTGAGLLNRFNSAATQIPTGTVSIVVRIEVKGSGLSIPVGSVLTFSHLLLEICPSTQTDPSAWADIDVQGNVIDIFSSGSSTGLRMQGSVLPTFTGTFSYSATTSAVTVSWTGLVIFWPDGGFTYIEDGSMSFTGLTGGLTYFAFLYFDVINGGLKAATPTTPVGTPALLSATYDAVADAACKQDGRVALTPGGITFDIPTSGTGTGTGGGTGGGFSYPGSSGTSGTVREPPPSGL
jgi:hypothetical protein